MEGGPLQTQQQQQQQQEQDHEEEVRTTAAMSIHTLKQYLVELLPVMEGEAAGGGEEEVFLRALRDEALTAFIQDPQQPLLSITKRWQHGRPGDAEATGQQGTHLLDRRTLPQYALLL